MTQPMVNAASRPHGWRNTSDLLGDLLYAFGWEPEKLKVEPATPRMFGEVPTDPEIRAAEYRRERVAKMPGLSLTWYQTPRHSFVTRSLACGAMLDEVSAAVGHSSPVVTRRHYDHHIRRSFSPTLCRGLGGAGEAQIIPFHRHAGGPG